MNGASFSYTFPAYSMTVLDLTPGSTLTPVVTPSGTHANYTVGAPAVYVDPGVTVSSSDTALSGATVTISAGTLQSGDTLGFTSPVGSGITGSYAAGVLTLSGSATPAQYTAALQSVTFSSTSTSTTTRAIAIVAIDGALDSNTAPEQVNVAPVAQATIGVTGSSQLDRRWVDHDQRHQRHGVRQHAVGSSISETYTITNSGTAALTLGTVSIGGTNRRLYGHQSTGHFGGGWRQHDLHRDSSRRRRLVPRTATVSFGENDPTADKSIHVRRQRHGHHACALR